GDGPSRRLFERGDFGHSRRGMSPLWREGISGEICGVPETGAAKTWATDAPSRTRLPPRSPTDDQRNGGNEEVDGAEGRVAGDDGDNRGHRLLGLNEEEGAGQGRLRAAQDHRPLRP